MKNKLLIFIMITLNANSGSSPFTISGKITDENGSPVTTAMVTVKGAITGTIVDKNGYYSRIIPVREGNATIIITAQGFTSRELWVIKSSVVNITLVHKTSNLGAVVLGTLKPYLY